MRHLTLPPLRGLISEWTTQRAPAPQYTGKMTYTAEEIKEQLRTDPDKGFRMLVSSFMQPVYNNVRRLVVNHDDAQDVTQETFVKIFKALPGIGEVQSLPAWIMKIATNEALRFLQTEKARTQATRLDAEEGVDLPADEYFDYSDIEAVKLQKAIHCLPPKQQAVFNLKYYDDLSYEEIGQITDCSPQTAKVNYHFAKKKIIELMSAEV